MSSCDVTTQQCQVTAVLCRHIVVFCAEEFDWCKSFDKMEFLNKRAFAKYPDLTTLADIYQELFRQETEPDGGGGGDDKYRPFLLLLAILFKIQEREETSLKARKGISVTLEECQETLELAGYYWHLQHKLGKGLREGINKVASSNREKLLKLMEKNKSKLEAELGVKISAVSVSELHLGERESQVAVAGTKVRTLTDHTPDWVISLQESHRAVVLTVLGTRVFPAPNPGDVIMDMACRTEPFLDGEAHAGMVVGERNLVKTALPTIIEELTHRPGFSLLVVGYSLGAALAQLLLLHLNTELRTRLPPGVEVRGLLYGVPPVYAGNQAPLDNVLMFSNHNDGITGASLKCLKDVIIKTRAIQNLHLPRRVLVKMALNIEGPESGISDDEADHQDKECSASGMVKKKERALTTTLTQGVHLKKEIMNKTRTRLSSMVNKRLGTSDGQWQEVEEAINNVQLCQHPELRFVGERLLVLHKSSSCEELKVSKISGGENLRLFSKEVKFKTGMINDHMPWAYNKLFSGNTWIILLKKIYLNVTTSRLRQR